MRPENKNIEDRTVYFDYLRVFATFYLIPVARRYMV